MRLDLRRYANSSEKHERTEVAYLSYSRADFYYLIQRPNQVRPSLARVNLRYNGLLDCLQTLFNSRRCYQRKRYCSKGRSRVCVARVIFEIQTNR